MLDPINTPSRGAAVAGVGSLSPSDFERSMGMDTLTAPPAGPSMQEVADELIETELREKTARVNVFADCLKDGKVTVATEPQASEIARMILRAEREVEDVKAIADAMVRRAEARLNGLEFLFMAPLAVWTKARLVGKKERSILLEGGKLSLRKVPASVKTVDPQLLSSWAVVNLGEAVELVPKVKADVVKAWEAKSGQIAPGRAATPESESFKVSVPK